MVVSEKRKLKPAKRKSTAAAALSSRENLTPEEKKQKKEAQDIADKEVGTDGCLQYSLGLVPISKVPNYLVWTSNK